MLDVRDQFPGVNDKIFLDAACVSLAPKVAVEAIQSFLEMTLRCPSRSSTELHIVMDQQRAEARPQLARLINAHADEIALVESTTHGLNIAAEALPLVRGDRVLLSDLEFLQVALPWRQKQQRAGIEVEVVPNRDGVIQIQDIADWLTPRTKAVVISSVQWSNGFRCDLAALSRLCREQRVWLVVDAIQHIGAMPMDVQATPIDLLACGGHKWLNAPFGCGFLYIRRDVMEQLKPPLGGYLSLQSPRGGWGQYFQTPSIRPMQNHSLVSQARRYEVGGTANYPGAIGLAASVTLINELGPARIAEHIYALTDRLIAGLQTLGVQVVTPIEREYRSGIVTFSVGSAQENVALMEWLLDHDVLVSVRYTSQVGGVRVSCHFFNSPEEIDRLLNLVEDHCGRH
ncbi:MAG: aminotransferase class V-fold PLP-dependent enzyme [Acidobacteriota bacterium]|nr:aminotransferase class V-fold PLP-dependent enzyme [Blastocatellia bacterium]MDW8239370.1 aminotransferase class V-fold PLP-dependent enzyme [Acidobacteriota bacterium]